MYADPMTLARARLALREASRCLRYTKVTLIDFGFPQHHGKTYTDELSILLIKRILG